MEPLLQLRSGASSVVLYQAAIFVLPKSRSLHIVALAAAEAAGAAVNVAADVDMYKRQSSKLNSACAHQLLESAREW